MAAILVLHATVDGQAARIAERIAQVLARGGHEVEMLPVQARAALAALATSEAVVVGGSIRYGRYPRGLLQFVRENRDALDARPNAFFSVCLSAGGPGANPAAAWGYVEKFISDGGWQPGRIASFAGALLYTRYNPFIRLLMRLIVGMAGGETDTSRDYEYTDWEAVERFAAELDLQLRPARAA
ncbi:MAG: menaquinone-dependent protoporphyrinogen IX dehydrogenase [Burkholderiales bacterium]|nr:menaquinone-dependent protoporphyrinogen IX dehydrogenase [Burkholderiales bacterium]